MPSVPASEFQKRFGEWHDKSFQGPVEITKYGRPTAYLVSADLFQQLWQRFRVSLPVEALQEADVDLIMQTTVETDQPYNLGDIPDIEEPLAPSKR